MQGRRFAAGLTAAALAITPVAAPAVSGAAKNGATGLQNLKLKKTKSGYRFGGAADSTVVYTDDTDEQGSVTVAGAQQEGQDRKRRAPGHDGSLRRLRPGQVDRH